MAMDQKKKKILNVPILVGLHVSNVKRLSSGSHVLQKCTLGCNYMDNCYGVEISILKSQINVNILINFNN